MKTIERIRVTLVVASAYALMQAVVVTVMRPLFREPIDHHYWHSLISAQHIAVEIPLCLLFGWFYPGMMRRAAERKARATLLNRPVTDCGISGKAVVAGMNRPMHNPIRHPGSVFAVPAQSEPDVNGYVSAPGEVVVVSSGRP